MQHRAKLFFCFYIAHQNESIQSMCIDDPVVPTILLNNSVPANTANHLQTLRTQMAYNFANSVCTQ